MKLMEQLQADLQERKEVWWEWHKKNPDVWLKFEEYTLEAIKSGSKSKFRTVTVIRLVASYPFSMYVLLSGSYSLIGPKDRF